MILIDTHIWLWWLLGSSNLSTAALRVLEEQPSSGVGVSVMSCWEVAMLAQAGKLTLPAPVETWIDAALAIERINLVDLTPQIAIEATRLPGTIHKDPVDRLLVATARVYDCPLVTVDRQIRQYPHVVTLP